MDTDTAANAERERRILELWPQVRVIALSYRRTLPSFVNFDDLMSAGTLGLIEAVDTYDPTWGLTLGVWAKRKIQWAVLDRNKADYRRDRRCCSLDSLPAEDEIGFSHFLTDVRQLSPEAELLARETRQMLRSGIELLPAPERRALVGHLHGRTCKEIAAEAGCHQTRISQLRLQAEERLRSYLRRRLTARPRADRRGPLPPDARSAARCSSTSGRSAA